MTNIFGKDINAMDVRLFVSENNNPIAEIAENGSETPITSGGSQQNNAGSKSIGQSGDSTPFDMTNKNDGATQGDIKTDENIAVLIPFTDVSVKDWFYDSIVYSYTNNLFNGTSMTTFGPNEPMTRAMFATVIYRAEGHPVISELNQFADVSNNQWYSDAIRWTSENEIVLGYENGNFGVNDNISREQIAAILYRYAQKKNVDTSTTNDLMAYIDADEVSTFALDAVKWVNAKGIMTGRSSTTLNPKDNATRAEVSALLMRFINEVVR
jgi:hypothetical protein